LHPCQKCAATRSPDPVTFFGKDSAAEIRNLPKMLVTGLLY
jgi:hypothetical protein